MYPYALSLFITPYHSLLLFITLYYSLSLFITSYYIAGTGKVKYTKKIKNLLDHTSSNNSIVTPLLLKAIGICYNHVKESNWKRVDRSDGYR